MFLMHEGNLVNGQGRDNARAEGECIIHPRPLTRLPERGGGTRIYKWGGGGGKIYYTLPETVHRGT